MSAGLKPRAVAGGSIGSQIYSQKLHREDDEQRDVPDKSFPDSVNGPAFCDSGSISTEIIICQNHIRSFFRNLRYVA
ncbi:hypothetical protein ACFX15_000833 [Malus domestica]